MIIIWRLFFMCTAITYNTKDFYFGRNLDLEYSYNEDVIITPRNFSLHFKAEDSIKEHYAIIGVGIEVEEYPLYYDGINEMGLAMAGLNFPGNAKYFPYASDKTNITPFELIPWILGRFATVSEVRANLSNLNILNEEFNEQYKLTPLHWIISDKEESIVLESVEEGLKVYDNPEGILTNNPCFPEQIINFNRYKDIKSIPGDFTSKSRFIRAAFIRNYSISDDNEAESVSQFFHILDNVAQPRGCELVGNKPKFTVYSSCCNASKGIYYYKTYDNSRINGVDMFRENLEQKRLIKYHLKRETEIVINN